MHKVSSGVSRIIRVVMKHLLCFLTLYTYLLKIKASNFNKLICMFHFVSPYLSSKPLNVLVKSSVKNQECKLICV